MVDNMVVVSPGMIKHIVLLHVLLQQRAELGCRLRCLLHTEHARLLGADQDARRGTHGVVLSAARCNLRCCVIRCCCSGGYNRRCDCTDFTRSSGRRMGLFYRGICNPGNASQPAYSRCVVSSNGRPPYEELEREPETAARRPAMRRQDARLNAWSAEGAE